MCLEFFWQDPPELVTVTTSGKKTWGADGISIGKETLTF